MRFPRPESLACATVRDIYAVIRPLGLKWRAPLLKQLGWELVELGGVVPSDYAGLVRLAGVGDYVASAWLSFHAKKRAVLIDANVVRWICRLTGKTFTPETRRTSWMREVAAAVTPISNHTAYNYALLDFTMQVCGRTPACARCPLADEHCCFARLARKTKSSVRSH
jgi:A/G-specific adenine glycosylase